MSSLVVRPLGGATAPPSKRDLATTNIPARSPPKAAARAIPAATSSSSASTEPTRKAGRAIPPSTGKRVGVLTATNSTKAGGSAGGGGGTSIGMRASGVKQVGGERELKTVVQPARVLLSSAAASGLKAPTTVSGGKAALSRLNPALPTSHRTVSANTLPRRLPSAGPTLSARSVSTTSAISETSSTPRAPKLAVTGSPRTLRTQTTLLSSAAAASATSTARKAGMQRVASSGVAPVTARKVSAPLKASSAATTSAKPMTHTPPRAPRLPSFPPPSTSRPAPLKSQSSAIPTARTKKAFATDSLEGQSIRSVRSFGSEMSDQGISIASALRAGKPTGGRKENTFPAISDAHLVAALARTDEEAGNTSWETIGRPSLPLSESLSTPLRLPSREAMSYLSPTFSPPSPSDLSSTSPFASASSPLASSLAHTTPRPRPPLTKRSTRDSASLEEILRMTLASARKGDEGEWLCDEGFSISMRKEMEGVGTPWRKGRGSLVEESAEGAEEGLVGAEGEEELGRVRMELEEERRRVREEREEWEKRRRAAEEERGREAEEEMEKRRKALEEEAEQRREEAEREREAWQLSLRREREELDMEKSKWKDETLAANFETNVDPQRLASQVVLIHSRSAFATAGASWREVLKGVRLEKEDLRLLAELVKKTLTEACLAQGDVLGRNEEIV